MTRHFLTGAELTRDELIQLVERALELKRDRLGSRALEGKSVALVFEKPSTRTRISFDVGVHELGGHPLVLRGDELQISRGESLRDVALVLSRMVHAIGVRTGPHEALEELARYSSVPVVNMLTREHHPCQALADLLTLRERFGRLEGLRLAYVGDGNNVARSLLLLGELAGMEVEVSSPPELALDGRPAVSPEDAARGAHALYADVWVSMGDEDDAERKRALLAPVPARRGADGARARRRRSRSTACPPTRARRSARAFSTASARRSGTRRRTACTPRRRCSSCSRADCHNTPRPDLDLGES